MKRRDFFTASAIAASGTLLSSETVWSAESENREYLRINSYWAKNEEALAQVVEKLDKCWIPFLNGYGVPKVGVFTVNRELHEGDKNYDKKYDLAVYTYEAHRTLESIRDFDPRAAKEISTECMINPSTATALCDEMRSELLFAFPHCPKLEAPTLSPDRIIQYRRYHSTNLDRNYAKLRMFDVRGELDLFRRCGMAPVFFAETLIGECMPNIAYALSFENDEARKKAWATFIGSDEWKTMKVEEEFKDTATKILNLFLKPSQGSQI